ncbi:MAG: DNA-processing protein DprA [Actinomycetota bacterium]|nr:DNA-processing protein DprA [Actinomycetota bacterium]
MNEPGVESACIGCLRRCWLVGRLGPFIQVACDDRPGRRTPELLRLNDEDLAAVVAPARVDEFLSWMASLDEGELKEEIGAAGCWACCRHDVNFPVGLLDGADAPPVLIGRGTGIPLKELDPWQSVTVVGARRASGYGLEVAASIGRDLVSTGMNVVSGLALGIDAAAHRGALERGPTVAVLGSGADRPYPVSHTRLYRQIAERGMILSEQPPGTEARRWGFPARNRIMAALSGMTVVVEAATRSGSLITAEMAADAGREVGAVPGPVTARISAGTNELIANGSAVIRDARDVLDRLVGVGAERPALFGPELAPGSRFVLDAIEQGCETVDSVSADCGRPVREVAAELTRLEVQGYLRGSTTGTWSRTTLAAPYPSVTDD